jgi:hypothetical protein
VNTASAQHQIIWCHCNQCSGETKHKVLFETTRDRDFSSGENCIFIRSAWSVIQCRGCDDVTLQRIDTCSEDDPSEGSNLPTYFPPREYRIRPNWIFDNELPAEYKDLMEEVYTALGACSYRLAMMGARTLIDFVIRRAVGDQGGFNKGLDILQQRGLLIENDRCIIEAAIDVGHASAHRGYCPTRETVDIVLYIVERLIHMEILVAQAKGLKNSTPSRFFGLNTTKGGA